MDINQNLNNLMKEAQKMQQRMQDAQQELTSLEVEGVAGDNRVIVKMNGRHDVLELHINPVLLQEDIKIMEVVIAAAINDAVRKVEKKSREKISQLTSGFNLPTDLLRTDDK